MASRGQPGARQRWERLYHSGESPNPVRASYKAGKGAGMNVNLAPVLDVSRNNGGFLDKFQRTYSSDPFKVATLGSAFITAQQKTGVAATSKHFPGLGAAKDDTDSAPVTLPLSKHTLRTVDEVPYHSAIAAGTELVMLSNATYPALDPNRPASLSPIVIQKELRGYLGFRGVTITDALEAGGLEEFGSVPERGVLALRGRLATGTSGGSRTGKPGSCLAVAPSGGATARQSARGQTPGPPAKREALEAFDRGRHFKGVYPLPGGSASTSFNIPLRDLAPRQERSSKKLQATGSAL